MKFKIITLLLIFTITFLPTNTFSQTQAEIEQMMNGDVDEKKAKKEKPKKEKAANLKAEIKKKEKELKAEEKLAKKKEKELIKAKQVLVEAEEVEKPKKSKKDNTDAEVKKESKKLAKQNKKQVEKSEEVLVEKKKAKKLKKQKKLKENPKKETEELAVKDETSKMNYNKLRKTGNKLGTKGSYYNAVDYYEKALFKAKNDKKKLQMYSQLANANYFLRDYQSAETYYKKAIELNSKPKKFPLLNLQLANTYKALAKYDSSVVEYKRFIENEQENKKLYWAVNRAENELKGSEYALGYVNEEPRYRVKNAGENVNGPFSEYGPEIVDSRLYFSKINSDKVVVLDDEIEEKEFSKIYSAEINNDTLDLYQDFAENVNSSKEHVGNPSFSKDGNTVYFTKCTLNKEMQSECKIYKSNRVNNVWSKAELLSEEVNQKNATNTQPQIIELAEENRLYFVSDREGGKGGKDIWYATMDNEGNFSNVLNIDYPINTAYDEVSPHYNELTKNFYFSSDGHTSFGGLDVFKVSKNENGEWDNTVENLGFPVNSSLDDYDFVLDNDETTGYLASNRVGTISLKSETCCDDIFAINPSKVDLFVKGKVFVENATKRSVLETADLYLYDNKTDERLEEIEYKNGKAFVAKLLPEMDYKIVAIADGYKNAEISFKTEGLIKSDTLEYNLFMENKDLTGYVLSKVYYEFDMSKLRRDAPDSLRKVVAFLNAYPDVIVEVASHTDSKGSEKYNLELSERRSLSVKNYLIYQQEISEKRLVNAWYGESKPVAPNTLKNGKDNPAGRDLNRRTEFKVIGYLKD